MLTNSLVSDTTTELTQAINLFSERHPSSHIPTTDDLATIKSIASFVSVRSSALVATCLYTLWDLRLESDQQLITTLPKGSPLREKTEADVKLEKTTVAFNGSVIENYPGYLSSCQRYLDDLVDSKSYDGPRRIELVPAKESSLIGAAVALACIDGEA